MIRGASETSSVSLSDDPGLGVFSPPGLAGAGATRCSPSRAFARLPVGDDRVFAVDVSRDGKPIVASVGTETGDVWALPLRR